MPAFQLTARRYGIQTPDIMLLPKSGDWWQNSFAFGKRGRPLASEDYLGA
jgi:hypothetical protein